MNNETGENGGCIQHLKGAAGFIDKIRAGIQQQGYKQAFVAGKVDVSGVHLSRVLNQHEPLTESLKKRLFAFLKL